MMKTMIRMTLTFGLLALLGATLMGCAGSKTEVGGIETELEAKERQIEQLRSEVEMKEKELTQTESKLAEQSRAAADAERRVQEMVNKAESGQGDAVMSGSSGGLGSGDLFPPAADAGECYARVFVPPVYETHSEQILHKQSSERIDVTPAEYEWAEQRVLVQEESKRLVEVPAKFEWIDEEVLERPAHKIWKKGRGLIEKMDNSTGEIMCLVEVPAQYRTVHKHVQVAPVTVEEVIIPAVYDTIRVKKTVNAPQMTRHEIPAEYKSVTRQDKVKDGYMEWRLVLCETNLNSGLVQKIQTALQNAGHNPGPIDGIIGSQTREAVKSYQKANQLPVGEITHETLKSLGLQS